MGQLLVQLLVLGGLIAFWVILFPTTTLGWVLNVTVTLVILVHQIVITRINARYQ